MFAPGGPAAATAFFCKQQGGREREREGGRDGEVRVGGKVGRREEGRMEGKECGRGRGGPFYASGILTG